MVTSGIKPTTFFQGSRPYHFFVHANTRTQTHNLFFTQKMVSSGVNPTKKRRKWKCWEVDFFLDSGPLCVKLTVGGKSREASERTNSTFGGGLHAARYSSSNISKKISSLCKIKIGGKFLLWRSIHTVTNVYILSKKIRKSKQTAEFSTQNVNKQLKSAP